MNTPRADRPHSEPTLPGLQGLRLDWKRLGLLLLLGALSIGLLLYFGGGSLTLATLGAADWRLVGLAALIHYSGFALRGHRWQRLLAAQGYARPYLYVTALLLAGWFVSALLPARAGDILRIGVLRADSEQGPPVPIADALGSIILERALDISAILLLGATFGFIVLQTRMPTWVLSGYALGILLVAAVGIALLIAPPLLRRLQELSAHSLWQTIIGFAAQFITSMRTLFREPLTALLVSGESLYIWLCDALLLWIIVWSLGDLLPFGEMAFVALTVDIFAAVPLTPGGIGQIESAYAALLSLLSTSTVNIAAVVLLVRAVSYWSFLLISGVVMVMAGFHGWLAGGRRSLADSSSADSSSADSPSIDPHTTDPHSIDIVQQRAEPGHDV